MRKSTKDFIFSDPSLVFEIRQGIERECLRVDVQGHTALTAHPYGLGSKLTHRFITTDYSENLLEFITGVHSSESGLFNELNNIHAFTYSKLGEELLWPNSMPAILPEEENIPIANFGPSHIGQLKTLYRKGLAHRYGKSMQSIAGLHYNFSLSDNFWKNLKTELQDNRELQEFKDENYFKLIRNFQRYKWLLIYFFSASNIVHKSFLTGKKHQLLQLSPDTYYNPEAVSLRMGGLGYTSQAQANIQICYNNVSSYIQTLEKARLCSYPPYEEIGLEKDGERIQLNTHLLQIDNEFYSTVRPKNVAKSKESALKALYLRGTEYIEIRLCDINPFSAVGISKEQVCFLQLFLMWCLAKDSDLIGSNECKELEENFKKVVREGNSSQLSLVRNQETVLMKDWMFELMEEIGLLAQKFSEVDGFYMIAFDKYVRTLEDGESNLSKELLDKIRTKSFISFNLDLAKEHKKTLVLSETVAQEFNDFAKISHQEEERLIKENHGDFETFLRQYFDDIRLDAGV